MCLRNMLKVGDRVKFNYGYGEIIEIDIYDAFGHKEKIYKIKFLSVVFSDTYWRFKDELYKVVIICAGTEWAFEKELLHIVTICA